MNPIVSKISEEHGVLSFSLNGVNVSIANGLRRVSSEIQSVVIVTTPHEDNMASFEVNTTRMNNELLKQRLSCIPIYSDTKFNRDDYTLVVDKQNKSNNVEYVTTKDFMVVNNSTNEPDKMLASKMFPPNHITGDYPELSRLLPRVSENIEGERLAIKAKFSLGSSKQNSSFNVTSTFVYSNTPDPIKQKQVWNEKKTELSKTHSAEELAFAEKDWNLLDAKRYFIPDSFDYTIESVGPFTNMEIVSKSVALMIEKLEKLKDTIQSDDSIITLSETTIPNSFDILLKGEDYTLGKVIEYVLYETHYDKTLTYCGFRKPHPHIDESLIRLGFKNPTDKVNVITYIVNAANESITIYNKIGKVFEVTE